MIPAPDFEDVSTGIDSEQLGLIIKHLFKVWYPPLSVDGVAMKSTTYMVPNPPFIHARESESEVIFNVLTVVGLREEVTE
jgi:hypothetical protein